MEYMIATNFLVLYKKIIKGFKNLGFNSLNNANDVLTRKLKL